MRDWLANLGLAEKKDGFRIPIATKLVLSFLSVIILVSGLFIVVGVQLLSKLILTEAQERVYHSLSVARELYLDELTHINDVVRFTADRHFLRNASISGRIGQDAIKELIGVRDREGLDVLGVTDKSGQVILRTSNVYVFGDDQSHNELIRAVLNNQEPVAATCLVAAEDLRRESIALAERACCKLIDTPGARAMERAEEKDGLMLKAAAPIFDYDGNLTGVLYGGILLNRNFEFVDKIKQTVFSTEKYKGKDIGAVAIFQGDVNIATNVQYGGGTRAIGTLVAEDVYKRVIVEGQPWIGRGYVGDDWYIAAYEPIRNLEDRVVGILYVGVLEARYADARWQTIQVFSVIMILGALASTLLSYFIAQRISVPIKELAAASRELARGNLDARVERTSNDELGELAQAFNTMAAALKERDKKLKEFAQARIMESERLALIGQLAANVAHELNNPLQGIVTYSHLLMEKMPCENSTRRSVEKIVAQADRCRQIIRGLLDFARQRKPDKTVCDVNALLDNCISLVENQALFQNIAIVKELDTSLPLVVADPSQIERVFMNIIINAAEAMDGGGRLSLATRRDPAGQFVEVEFTDTGPGIPEENLEKIFDPFFTTKDVGRGTGLGLAISYGIVKEHGGTIGVESEVGKGTTFTVRLPIRTEGEVAESGRERQDTDH